MALRPKPEWFQRGTDLPLKLPLQDPRLWAKIAAMWHRERVREQYLASGYPPAEARIRANEEAAEVARRQGWKGTTADLKRELAELLTRDIPSVARRSNRLGKLYWEELVQEDLKKILCEAPDTLRVELAAYLQTEVAQRGRFSGRNGLYKAAFIVAHVPTLDHLRRRNAFIDALTEFGGDSEACDADLVHVAMRLMRQYTLKPFETRLGFSMPARRDAGAPRRRRLFGPRSSD